MKLPGAGLPRGMTFRWRWNSLELGSAHLSGHASPAHKRLVLLSSYKFLVIGGDILLLSVVLSTRLKRRRHTRSSGFYDY